MTRGEMPPSTSASAAAKAWRSSVNVSPPASAASKSPSGLSARRIWMSVPGRSLTNCRARPDTTRSSEASRNGRASSSAATASCAPDCASPGSRGHDAALPAAALAAMIVPTFPLAARTRRTAAVGVPRSSAQSKRRSTAASRSERSSATRSIRNVDGPSAAARARYARWRARSKMMGRGGTIALH